MGFKVSGPYLAKGGIDQIHSRNSLLIGWDLVAHPVTQVIGEQALVDILDVSEVAWTCWGVLRPAVGWG